MKQKKKYLLILALVLALVIGVSVIGTATLVGITPKKEVVSSPARTFRVEIRIRARERHAYPIEGFDAQNLMRTFPGFQEVDFDGVVTGGGSVEGAYHFRDGKLQWERAARSPRSSAADSILGQGFETLLENLSRRLNVNVSQESQVKGIVDMVDTKKNEKPPEGL